VHQVTKAILQYHQGRDPERVGMKLAALRAGPFAFFRGTAPLFYSTLRADRALTGSPLVLACGDLHLENFGSYKGDNRLVYFDLVDFDEACVAPVEFELARFLTSILVAAKPLKFSDTTAAKMVAGFIEAYAANIASTKPRWVERSLATGPVRKLLQSLKGRHRSDLVAQRTVRKAGKVRLVIDGKRALAVTAQDRVRAESILAAYASTQSSTSAFEPIDIARRISGNGSLGLERFVALVRGNGKADGQTLIDIKLANPSALAANIGTPQPRWRSEAERVVSIQRIVQAIPPAMLGAVGFGKRSYLIKELEPTADRVNLASLGGKSASLNDVIRTMAEVTAWGHLRACSRFGASAVDTLGHFAAQAAWRGRITQCAHEAQALAKRQWKAYSADYDTDAAGLISTLSAGKI
jgi:uncharacterized protein (DUF2252 family)